MSYFNGFDFEKDKPKVCPFCGNSKFESKSKVYRCVKCDFQIDKDSGIMVKEGKCNENYSYCKDGEEMGIHQPNLEFFNGKEWVKSGLISGRCLSNYGSDWQYRYRKI